MSLLAESQSVCYHFETTTTDENGRYTIPGWVEKLAKWHVGSKSITLTFFYPGYEDVGAPANVKNLPEDTEYMAPFFVDSDRTYREQRLEYLSKYYNSCYVTDGSDIYITPTLQAIYNEAKSIATTKADKKVICGIHHRLERIVFDRNVAIKNLAKCKEQIK